MKNDSKMYKMFSYLLKYYFNINNKLSNTAKKLVFSFGTVIFIFIAITTLPVSLAAEASYPWLEQISRQDLLTAACDKFSHHQLLSRRVNQLDHILVDHRHRFLYCYVPKVACTNWKRVFMVLTQQSNATNLITIPASLAHADNTTLKLSQLPVKEAIRCLQTYTTFLMVRHPFERLLSAYRNKFSDLNDYFHSRYGKHIIQKYRKANDSENVGGVTFREFVKYLIDEGPYANEHWIPIYALCKPCQVNYTFIGRYETLAEDTRTLLNMIGQPSINFPVTRNANTKQYLRKYYQQLSIMEIKHLYKLYEMDFKLFGYSLEDIIGYDLG